jgi:hypothetical protein
MSLLILLTTEFDFNLYIIDYGESTSINTLKSQIKNNSICFVDESKLQNIRRIIPEKITKINKNNENNRNSRNLKLPPIIPRAPRFERRKAFGSQNTTRPKTPTLENIIQKLKSGNK